MLQPIDDSVGKRILCHRCGLWREVALQHLTGSSTPIGQYETPNLGCMPDARLEISAYSLKAAWPYAPTCWLLRAMSQEPFRTCFL